MENTDVRAKRIDARKIDKNEKVIVIEMSSPCLENCQLKEMQDSGNIVWWERRGNPKPHAEISTL